ncbi:MAG: C69 family dipeptidase [bacterium]|nr:C69 family dipeptidase [bacterium]
MGCDSFVVLGPAARYGTTLFAKNSDRPPRECQRIVQVPRRVHPDGARVRCQSIELPQVRETAAMIGSQPWWLWGFEHGVNEHGVAIGNETVFAREALGPRGLLGMDLVRLGLERGRSASEALDVMTALLEEHGQGGSGQFHVEWPYHNGFLVADKNSAWMLETSDRHWVARRVRDVAHISNGLSLGADWERGAADVTAFAVAQGWWSAAAGPVDFAAAYADTTGVPPNVCAGRWRRAAALLGEGRGALDVARLRAILRDHHADGPSRRPRPFQDDDFFTLCMHADPLDNTTASMIASLPVEAGALRPAWIALGSPCIAAYLPVWLDGTVPAVLADGGRDTEPGSPWWKTRRLLDLVEHDLPALTPRIREHWTPFEHALDARAAEAESEVLAARHRGDDPTAARILTTCMTNAVTEWQSHMDALIAAYSR